MANSIVDDVINEENNSNVTTPKKSSKKVFFILILLILIIIAIIAAVIYFKKKNEVTPKIEFLNYLSKNNYLSVFSFDGLNIIKNKLQSESSESTTQIVFNIPVLNINETSVLINSKSDPENQKKYIESSFDYEENEVLATQILSNENEIGIKSDEIVVKYLGAKYENLGKVLTKIYGENFSYLDNILELISDEKTSQSNEKIEIPDNIFDKYIEILRKCVDDTSFASKPITLERSDYRIDVTEYTMTINEEKAIEIIVQMLQTLENDETILSIIADSYENFGITKELIKLRIEDVINRIYDEPVDKNRTYSLKIYGQNDITYKMVIDIAGEVTLDFDYEYGEKENSVLITLLETKSQDGFKIEFVKSITDVSEKLNMIVNLISNADIIGELTITSTLLKTGNTYDIKNSIDLNYASILFTININSTIRFGNVEIDDLDNDNCIFLDTLDDDTFNDIINAVEEKTIEVLNSKTKPFSNIENTRINSVTESTKKEDKNIREEIRIKIYNAIANDMGQAIANGEEYTLSNVENLQIPDSTVSVSTNDNIAVINVDGYEFTLDADFNLSF